MATPEPNRLFFALWPHEALRARIAEQADALFQRRGLRGHPSRPARYHLTLYFLGDAVPFAVEASARTAAARIEAPPFFLQLDQAGSFNNPQVPVWFGPSEIPAELAHLDQALRRALKGLPVGPTPRFKPHLTVMRDASQRLRPEPLQPIAWRVEEFVLIRSHLDKGRFRYEVLETYPLRGSALPPPPEQGRLF